MKHRMKRLLALALTVAMLLSAVPMAAAAQPQDRNIPLYSEQVKNLTAEEQTKLLEQALDKSRLIDPEELGEDLLPSQDEMVDVIVLLDVDSLYDVQKQMNQQQMAFSDFMQTAAAQRQLEQIASVQSAVETQMEEAEMGRETTYTYASLLSGFATRVRYGDIAKLRELSGVRDVVLSVTYEKEKTEYFPDEGVDNAVYPAGASFANTTDYLGEGMLIGILDTGLDTTHEAFVNEPQSQKLHKDDLESLLYTTEDGQTTAHSYAAYFSAAGKGHLLTADELYKNGKVPFAFDYADYDPDICPSEYAVENLGNNHGTHVAGIAAGKAVDAEGNVTFSGAAPEAQLAIFKVFSDRSSGATTAAILAALSDAVLVGVDVVNMSLGSAGGFGAEESDGLLDQVYGLMDESGISMCVSAGNSYSSAYGAPAGDYATTSNVDYGIVSSPSSYKMNLSVASINAAGDHYFSAAGTKITYTDLSGHDFAAELGAGSYAYVMIPGTGDVSDFSGLDVSGKIAVIQRGSISFEQKQLNAAAAGAIACLIYNNRQGEAPGMAITEVRIPTASITLASSETLASAETQQITLEESNVGEATMSGFSSWGPLPSLELKPEITAPGGGIYSSVPFNNAYDYMSGTSMAAPYMSGVSAAMREYLNEKYPALSAGEVETLANRLFMSTAVPVTQNGVQVSPRKQGAGLVNLNAALTSETYLYVDGSERTKVELGDDPQKAGTYAVQFHVKNTGSEAQSYTLSTSVLTEAVSADGKYMAQKPYVLSADTSDVTVSGASLNGTTLLVEAGADALVTVTIRLSASDRAYLEKYYANGCYVEGFVTLSSETQPDLSIPYLGFYGNWAQAPMLDADEFSGETADVFASTVYGVYGNQSLMLPGRYALQLPEGVEEPAFSEEKIAMALDAGNAYGYLYSLPLGLLRGAKHASVSIADRDTGKVYYSYEGLNIRKAMFNQSANIMYPAFVGDIYPDWDAMKASGLDNNTRLTITAKVSPDAEDTDANLKDTFGFNMTVDYEAPYVVNRNGLAFYEGEDGRMYLDVTFEDNQYLMAATLYSAGMTLTGGIGVAGMYYDYFTPLVNEDGSDAKPGTQISVTYDVTDFYDKLYEGTFFIVAYDYALNCCMYQVSVAKQEVTAIEMAEPEKTMKVGETSVLDVKFTPAEATDKRLNWTTTDADVVLVKDGEVTALKEGTATVTATSASNAALKAACTITVSGKAASGIPVTALTLSKTSVSMSAGGSQKLTVTYTPYNATERTLTWTSSAPEVASVEDGLIQGLSEGSAVITATAPSGVSASCAVTVKAGSAGGFVIDENDVLTAYTGTDSIVVIPEGVKELGKRAFYDNDNIVEVYAPSTLTKIGESALGYCDNLKKIDLSKSQVTEIGRTAFRSDQLLESITLPDTVELIDYDAFGYCKMLKSITIPASVKTLGDKLFEVCFSLESVHFEGSPENIGKIFSSCYSLKEVTGNLTKITDDMFDGGCSLGDFKIPDTVTYIGKNAFTKTNASTGGAKLPDGSMVYGTGLKHIIFGADSAFEATEETLGGAIVSNCTSFEGYIVESGNRYLKINENGWLMSQNGTYLIDGSHDAKLTSVSIPEGVKYLGAAAFSGCVGLTELNLPSTLETIGEHAFASGVVTSGSSAKALALKAIHIPDSVKTIGAYAFAKCQNAEEITFGSGVQSIGESAFYNCKKAQTLEFPATLQTIGKSAFDGCDAVQTISLGATQVKEIASRAFYNTVSLKTLTLPETLESVGGSAFYTSAYRGNGVTELHFPASLTNLESSAFADFTSLKKVDLSGTQIKVIKSSAFTTLKSVTELLLPDTLEELGMSAFANMDQGKAAADPHVSGVYLPASVKNLHKDAFKNCTLLANITVDPANETYYNNESGAVCKRADNSVLIVPTATTTVTEDFTVPSNVTEIPSGYLQNNTTLKTLVIPASVTVIGSNAFRGCTNLESVTFEARTTELTIGTGAFNSDTALKSLILPEGLTVIGTSAFGSCTALESVTLPESLTTISLNAFSGCTALRSIRIPDGVTSIGNGAFSGCTALEDVTLPAGLESLTRYLFQNCTALKTITLPAGLTDFGKAQAFIGCTALEEIRVASGNTAFKTVDGVLFDASGKTLLYYPAAKAGSAYIVPEGTARIGENAFYGALGLRSVTLNSTVVRIGDAAFYGCENLTDYRFESMTAPVLECYQYISANALQIARYNNFKDYYFDVVDSKVVEKDLGLTLYAPEGAQGYETRLWKAFFGTHNTADASLLAVKDLTAVRDENGNVALSWTAAEETKFETVYYRVERAQAVRISDGVQQTWDYGTFTTLESGCTTAAYLDTVELPFGVTYAYRVTAYTARENGAGAVTTIYIAADPTNPDEAAAEKVIREIEALKPLDQLTAEDAERVKKVLEDYERLTPAQKKLVHNYEDLLTAIDYVSAAAVIDLIEALPDPSDVRLKDMTQIREARAAYDALTPAQKALVWNIGKLEECEEMLRLLGLLVIAADDDKTPNPGDPNLPAEGFTDIGGHWAEDSILSAVSNSLFSGVSAERFAPNDNMTRAMLVTVLYRLEGTPAVFAANRFSDVASGSWYERAVIWAAENNIVNGVGGSSFAPQQPVTREQMVAILYRYANYTGRSTGAGESLNAFRDAAQVSSYARSAMQWAVSEGLINGANGQLSPKGYATRAQVAAILVRYLGLR